MLDPTPIVFGLIRTKKGTDRNTKTIKILLNSGGSSTIVKRDIVKELCIVENSKTLWTTTAGNFSTTGTCKVTFQLRLRRGDSTLGLSKDTSFLAIKIASLQQLCLELYHI